MWEKARQVVLLHANFHQESCWKVQGKKSNDLTSLLKHCVRIQAIPMHLLSVIFTTSKTINLFQSVHLPPLFYLNVLLLELWKNVNEFIHTTGTDTSDAFVNIPTTKHCFFLKWMWDLRNEDLLLTYALFTAITFNVTYRSRAYHRCTLSFHPPLQFHEFLGKTKKYSNINNYDFNFNTGI